MRNILSLVFALLFGVSSPLEAQTLFSVTNQLVVPITNYDASACTGSPHDDASAFNAMLAANTPNWWASGTTYASGTVVMSGDGFLYTSTINGNVGNNPAFGGNSSDWVQSGTPPKVIVTVPLNAQCYFKPLNSGGTGFYPCGNQNTGTRQTIPNLTIFGPGATMTLGGSAGGGGNLGCLAFKSPGSGFGLGKLLQTAYKGQSCVLTITGAVAGLVEI